MVAHGRVNDKVWQILVEVADHKLDGSKLRGPCFIPEVMGSVVTLEGKWEGDRDKKKMHTFQFTFNDYSESLPSITAWPLH